MVSVGELGTDVDSLESNLARILELATRWKAVLLIDEADIFMEERTDLNIERNAMVGVFLRLLEYYQGVLFLTSNRAANLDPAFFSRINMSLNFPEMTYQTRMTIWNNILNLYGVKGMDVNHLANYDLNGRQIKNMVRIGQALAKAEGGEVQMSHILKPIQENQKFLGALKDKKKLGQHHTIVTETEDIRPRQVAVAREGYWNRLVKAIFGLNPETSQL